MQVSVTFRQLDPTDALKEFAAEKVAKLQKYIHTPTDARVVLSVERYMHKADIKLSAYGMVIRGEEKSDDMYASIDKAVSKIERQVKRYQKKLTSHKPREGARMKIKLNVMEAARETSATAELDAVTAPAAVEEAAHAIVETKEFNAEPLTPDEAVMQMDLLHNDFLVFVNANTGEVNVIYRRSDENYGLIEAHGTAAG